MPVHHAPRLEFTSLRLAPARRAVTERHRPVVPDRFPERTEGRLGRPEPRLDGLRGGPLVCGIHAGRSQLKQRSRGRPGQLGPLPDPGGQAEHRRLIRLEP
jgi:hypothetical protein